MSEDHKNGLCYTVKMMEPSYYSDWSTKVRDRKLTGLVLVLLEGAGPIRYVLSQGLFAILPFVDPISHGSWQAFAEMLESPADTRSFAAFLREERI